MRSLAIWMVLVFLPVTSFAQGLRPSAVLSESGMRPGLELNTSVPHILSRAGGLLDPSRLSMSHTYSMMFSSDGRSGELTGLYLNTLRYRFDAPLFVEVQMGYLHRGGVGLLSGGSEVGGGRLVVPGVQVQYRPSKWFTVTVQYGYSSSDRRYDLERHYRLRRFGRELFEAE